jgi:hypothetical protein
MPSRGVGSLIATAKSLVPQITIHLIRTDPIVAVMVADLAVEVGVGTQTVGRNT